MADNELLKNGHITALSFLQLEAEQLSDSAREIIAFHLSSCETCMEQYLDSFTNDTMVTPPETLEPQIMSYIAAHDNKKQQTKIMVMQFLKLSVAVSLTMAMIFGGVFDRIEAVPSNIINSIKAMEQVEQNTHKPEPIEEKKAGISFYDIADSIQDGFNSFAFRFNNGKK